METAGIRGEIIVADNGSSDGSQATAEKLQRARSECRPRKATAPRSWAESRRRAGKWVIMGDADDSYDFLPHSALRGKTTSGIRPGHGKSLSGRHTAAGNAAVAPLHSAIQCFPGSADCSSIVLAAIFTVDCGLFARTQFLVSTCKRQEWNLPARWWSRLRRLVCGSPRSRPRFRRTAGLDRLTCAVGATGGDIFASY